MTTMTTHELRELASLYLEARALYLEMDLLAPTLDKNGDPVDPDRWVAWYERSLPVRDAYSTTAKAFALAVGEKSTHPFTLEPKAKEIV